MHLHKLQLLEVVGKRQNMPFCISLFSIFIQIGASLTLASFLTDEFVLSPFSSITRRTAPSFTPNTRSRYLPFCRLDHFSHNIIIIIFQTQFSRTQTKSPKKWSQILQILQKLQKFHAGSWHCDSDGMQSCHSSRMLRHFMLHVRHAKSKKKYD